MATVLSSLSTNVVQAVGGMQARLLTETSNPGLQHNEQQKQLASWLQNRRTLELTGVKYDGPGSSASSRFTYQVECGWLMQGMQRLVGVHLTYSSRLLPCGTSSCQ